MRVLQVHVGDEVADLGQGDFAVDRLVVVEDVGGVEVDPEVRVLEFVHGIDHPSVVLADPGMSLEAVSQAQPGSVVADSSQVGVERGQVLLFVGFTGAAHHQVHAEVGGDIQFAEGDGEHFGVERVATGDVATGQPDVVVRQSPGDTRQVVRGGLVGEQRVIPEDRFGSFSPNRQLDPLDPCLANLLDGRLGAESPVAVGKTGDDRGHLAARPTSRHLSVRLLWT